MKWTQQCKSLENTKLEVPRADCQNVHCLLGDPRVSDSTKEVAWAIEMHSAPSEHYKFSDSMQLMWKNKALPALTASVLFWKPPEAMKRFQKGDVFCEKVSY